ncbi:pilus assembly protein TadG-related protein [Aquabacterium sp.]|uniref:pilus assembly protein TadG-related protein n=1 Tax=Aquabacterium sp. TaxID=1872578 RepID=UPI002489516D|nr:pilus assembly protein TadG-related protein [Aquabacterium sp.]MDI1260148.1 hypothetical protein [Aquabacterium sp.]
MTANPLGGWPISQGAARQRGQALVYGLFVLAGGLTALFFLFNVGQLTLERDKLTTTADAVAYSAGVMNARALNFTAYTNRALVANEVAVAQMVSLASWTHLIESEGQTAATLGCETIWNFPYGATFARYGTLCMGLFYSAAYTASISQFLDNAAPVMVTAIEGVKTILQGTQAIMVGVLIAQRPVVMQEVADANYRNNGSIRVELPLEDDFLLFDGSGPFLTWRTGAARNRLASAAVAAANSDPFVPGRNWTDEQDIPHPCAFSLKKDQIDRTGGTSLVGLNEWRAADNVRYTHYYTRWSWRGPRCRSTGTTWASGKQSAGGKGSSTNWTAYKGIPSYLDLSDRALSFTPENGNPNKRDPRLRFTARLTRDVAQTATSEGRSSIKPAPGGGMYGINQFKSNAAKNQYGAVATSEVYFERPVKRADGRIELANVFNPYWQVRLVETSNGVKAVARALQGVAF